jgi:hypothetical protein
VTCAYSARGHAADSKANLTAAPGGAPGGSEPSPTGGSWKKSPAATSSGTVARTERIPLAERAEAATIAWLRHQTTAYDTMRIPLVKGRRREVRRLLAQHSHQLLRRYREGVAVDPAQCPLQAALRRAAAAEQLPGLAAGG